MKQQVFEVLVPRDGTMTDLLAALQKKAGFDEETMRDARVYETHGGKIYREFQSDSKIAGINEYVVLYAERTPEDELNLEEGARTINAFNFDREPSRPHGVPFKFVVKPVSISLPPSFHVGKRMYLTFHRVKSSRKRRNVFPNEPVSRASSLRRSNLPWYPDHCTPAHDILTMVSASMLWKAIGTVQYG